MPRSANEQMKSSVRSFGRIMELGLLGGIFPKPSYSSQAKDFLSKRVDSFDAMEYHPGLTSDDVYYPSWFLGKWKAESKFTAFRYPFDNSFGGPSKNATASEIGTDLLYICKFTTDRVSDKCVSDRLYNVEQIGFVS